MPACTVCTHPARAAIDHQLVMGATRSAIVRTHSELSESSVQRHKARCLAAQVAEAEMERVATGRATAGSYVELLDSLAREAFAYAGRSMATNAAYAPGAIREARESLRAAAEWTGQKPGDAAVDKAKSMLEELVDGLREQRDAGRYDADDGDDLDGY